MTLRLPKLHGIIDRRILINFTVDPNLVEKLLPTPFKPKLYKQKAIVGICLIRLKNIKPKYFPDFLGFSSENGAHRIAVEWQEGNETKEGVYVPRRDTGSKLNAWIGGKLFPGKHYLAQFDVKESNGHYQVAFTSSDDTKIAIQAKEVDQIPQTSIFENLTNVSDFFQKGAIGYSPNGKKLDGIKLHTYQWQMQPLEVESVYSSYFENEKMFPKGSVQFDNALLMKKIEHEWHAVENKMNIF